MSKHKESKIIYIDLQNIVIEKNHNSRRNPESSASLEELLTSVKHTGILHPLIVRTKNDKKDTFYIVAGERRYHVAKQLKMQNVPCII
ncbi:MAG: ParB/RepB/Spo0J family partition protein, partial [Desulfobacteraceae bacterium]